MSEVFRGFERASEVFRGFSKALSKTLSECHFPLRVAGRVAPNRVAPSNSCSAGLLPQRSGGSPTLIKFAPPKAES